MTISTERLKERIDRLRKQAADVKWVSTHAAQEMMEVADALAELLAAREAQSIPVAWTDREELAFNHDMACMWTKGMGINEVALYTAPPAVQDQQLINIANHIAGSAGGLSVEWQDWASELVSDLRRLAVSNPAPAVPGDVEFNAWINTDENRAETMKCPISLGTARSAWFGCCAAMLQLSGDAEPVSVVPQSAHLTRAINLTEEAKELADRIRAEELTPPSVQTDELVMQIRRLVHALKKAKPDSSLVQQVTDYMKRHGYFKATDCLRGEIEGKN
ncbi:hypothetical protein [Serratia fonticola]|uniref:hypothetical protein n=1 Tax=Serratia fonticola TaxID=47917 RepID=UPI0015C629CE|nr:hypothetical protein [Serratia fonticola]NYA15731.1 hypothetical protein [Serratia fonticola]NYA35851.1 hypothetical protein [Serratia fonticola]